MQLPFLPNAKMHVMGAESGPLARPGLALNLMPRFIFLPIAFLSRAKFLFETSAYSPPPPSRTLANKTMTFRHAWGTPYMQQGLLVIQCQPPPCPSVFHAVPGIYNIEFDDSESAPLLFYGFSFSLEVAYPPLPSLRLPPPPPLPPGCDAMGYI